MNPTITLLAAVVVVGSSVWVAVDASMKKIPTDPKGTYTFLNGALAWFLLCLVMWIVGVPLYLYYRSKTLRERADEALRPKTVVHLSSPQSPYYLCVGSEQRGPLTIAQLQGMWRSGSITSEALYWQEGQPEWLPLSGIMDLVEVSPATVVSTTTTRAGFPRKWIVLGVGAVAVAFLMGFFHVVILNDLPLVSVIPKKQFTYSLSLVTVREVIERYNNRSLSDAVEGDPVLDNLVRELKQRQLVKMEKRTWDEVGKKIADELPDK
ncbi:MAG: DUF4339 domain-containing protein [Verrucomicrobiae bacterium]|nr:DUF4339 domain-containing protein [Verrucomicrobiae bacterium]